MQGWCPLGDTLMFYMGHECMHVCLQIYVCRQVLCVCVCVPQAAGPSAKSPDLAPSREGPG